MIGKIAVPASTFEPYRADRLEMASLLRRRDFTPLPHDRVLASRLALAFEQGVARLEPRPDDDPRWTCFAGSLSHGEYESVVGDLLERRLRACPGDDDIRWFLIAYTLFLGANDFAADLFSALVVRDPMNLRRLIAGAAWVCALSGVDTVASLREELLLLEDVVPGVGRHIERLGSSDDTHARWIAAIGLAAHNGATLYDIRQAVHGGFPRETMSFA